VAQATTPKALKEILDYHNPRHYDITPPAQVLAAATKKLREMSDASSAIGRLGRNLEKDRGIRAYASGNRAGRQTT